MLRRTMWMAAVAVLASPAVWAQDPRLEIGGNVGWTFSDGVSGQAVLAPDGNLYDRIDPTDSISYTLTIGYFVTENLEVGFLWDRQQSTLEASGTATREVGDMNIDNYHGTITYNFGYGDAPIRPYVLGGVGATRYGGISFTGVAGQTMQTDGETQFSSTWGLGVKIYPGRALGINLGARWTPTYIKSDFGGVWCDPYWGWCYTVGDPQYSNQFELSGGITLRF